MSCAPTIALLILLSAAGTAVAGPLQIVIAAPGYPGDAEQAQPTMDAFARALEQSAGWEPGRVAATYRQTLEGAAEALAADSTTLAVVPLPYYLEYRSSMELEPLLTAVPDDGPGERWSLVARKGAVSAPASLAGWSLAGLPGYAPRFVRHVMLADWGELPGDVKIRFSSRAISELRKAAKGDQVAALLDGEQTAALDKLPFAGELEVVARSGLMPTSVVCAVGGRLDDEQRDLLRRTLLALHEDEAGRQVLESMWLERFDGIDAERLTVLERQHDTGEEAAR